MADGPTVVQTEGSGGTIVAVILAIVAAVVLLFFVGVFDFKGGDGGDVDVKVDLPKVEAPANAPAAPSPAPPQGG